MREGPDSDALERIRKMCIWLNCESRFKGRKRVGV